MMVVNFWKMVEDVKQFIDYRKDKKCKIVYLMFNCFEWMNVLGLGMC